jgi:hypothetical protein
VLAQACHFILYEIIFSLAMLASPEAIIGTRVHALYGVQEILVAELGKVLADREVHFYIVHNAGIIQVGTISISIREVDCAVC